MLRDDERETLDDEDRETLKTWLVPREDLRAAGRIDLEYAVYELARMVRRLSSSSPSAGTLKPGLTVGASPSAEPASPSDERNAIASSIEHRCAHGTPHSKDCTSCELGLPAPAALSASSPSPASEETRAAEPMHGLSRDAYAAWDFRRASDAVWAGLYGDVHEGCGLEGVFATRAAAEDWLRDRHASEARSIADAELDTWRLSAIEAEDDRSSFTSASLLYMIRRMPLHRTFAARSAPTPETPA